MHSIAVKTAVPIQNVVPILDKFNFSILLNRSINSQNNCSNLIISKKKKSNSPPLFLVSSVCELKNKHPMTSSSLQPELTSQHSKRRTVLRYVQKNPKRITQHLQPSSGRSLSEKTPPVERRNGRFLDSWGKRNANIDIGQPIAGWRN